MDILKGFQLNEDRIFRYVDSQWYLAKYPDVEESELDPAEHFVHAGAREDRWPNPYFHTRWFRKRYLAENPIENPLLYFLENGKVEKLSPNAATSWQYLHENYPTFDDFENALDFLFESEDVIDNVSEYFCRSLYLKENFDVAQAGVVPEHHWLTSGLKEGRRPHSDYVLMPLETARKGNFIARKHVVIDLPDNERYLLKNISISSAIATQILEQSQIEPDILAPGADCFKRLKQFDSDDLQTRDLVDFDSLVQRLDLADSVIIVPRLGVGGGEKYAAGLAESLLDRGDKVTLLTTESNVYADNEALELHLLKPFRRCNRVSIWRYMERSWRRSNILALLLLSLHPKNVFVINSDLGLEMVADYGAPLSRTSNLFVCFFSQAPASRGVTFSSRYLRRVMVSARIISDNKAALDHFRYISGDVMSHRLFEVPQQVALPTEDQWERLLAYRLRMDTSGPKKVLWASRWEPNKAIDVLLELANSDPDLEIHVYGASKGDPHVPPRVPSNIHFAHQFSSIEDIPVHEFSVFVFTSYFEGMPNIVLEMAAACIPIVASNVGGLRETFAENEIEYVEMGAENLTIVAGFSEGIDRILSETKNCRSERMNACREALVRRHTTKIFQAALDDILELPAVELAGSR